MSNYDSWKTTEPDDRDPGRHPSRLSFRCVECRRSFDASAAVMHYDQTAHVITRGEVIQQFSFTPACKLVSRPEEVMIRR